LENTVYALDATTIDLCLSMFPWANFRKNKGAIKLHTLLDLRGSIPTFIHISTANSTRLTPWTSCRWKQEPSTSWVGATLTSGARTLSPRLLPSEVDLVLFDNTALTSKTSA